MNNNQIIGCNLGSKDIILYLSTTDINDGLTNNTNERSMKKIFTPILNSLIVCLSIFLYLSFGSLGCENEDDTIDPLLVGYWKLSMTAYGNESQADTTVVSDDVMIEVISNGTYRVVVEGKSEVKRFSTDSGLIRTSDNSSYKYYFTDGGHCLVLRHYDPDLIGITGFFRSLIFKRTK